MYGVVHVLCACQVRRPKSPMMGDRQAAPGHKSTMAGRLGYTQVRHPSKGTHKQQKRGRGGALDV